MFRCFQIKNNVSVEPAYVLYCLAYYLMDLVNTNLYIQKSCRFNTTSEPDLDTPCDDETKGVIFLTTVNSIYRCSLRIAFTLFGIFFTTWSDKIGGKRKIFIILPIIALILQNFSLCYHAYYWHWPATFAVWCEIIFQIGSGGNVCFLIFAQIHVFESSSIENRTFKSSILSALQSICVVISSGLSGYLIYKLGFYYTYFLCLILSILSLIFSWILIQDTSKCIKHKAHIYDAFRITHIIDSFKIVFRKRMTKERMIIIILLLISNLGWFSVSGERTILYLYFRYRFNWDERMYSIFLTFKLIGNIIGTLFCSIILSKTFKIHDGVIGSFAAFWSTLQAVSYLFANKTWQLNLIPLLDIFNNVTLSVCDCFVSKFFHDHEFGRLFSVHMTFDLIVPLSVPMYNFLFKSTMEYFPSAFFLISIPVNVLVFILYSIAYYLNKNRINNLEVTSDNIERCKVEVDNL